MSGALARAGRWTQTALSVGLLSLGCALMLASLAGVRLLPVMTGSMSPYAPAGALVVTTGVDPTSVAVGDVVAFRPPWPYQVEGDRPVFHRVSAIETTSSGLAMRTQGDANPAADPWLVSLQGADLARAVVVLPVGGHLLAGGPLAVALLLGGSVLLLVAARAVGAHLVRRRAQRLHPSEQPCSCNSQPEAHEQPKDELAVGSELAAIHSTLATQGAALPETIDLSSDQTTLDERATPGPGAVASGAALQAGLSATSPGQSAAHASPEHARGLLPSPRTAPDAERQPTASTS